MPRLRKTAELFRDLSGELLMIQPFGIGLFKHAWVHLLVGEKPFCRKVFPQTPFPKTFCIYAYNFFSQNPLKSDRKFVIIVKIA